MGEKVNLRTGETIKGTGTTIMTEEESAEAIKKRIEERKKRRAE